MSGYDASEWKPGDVGIVRSQGMGPVLAQMGRGRAWVWVDLAGKNPQGSGQACYAHESGILEARRLVVIDAEAAEQVERLVGALTKTSGEFDDIPVTSFGLILADALREFARPTPRIEEPLGLGAVVEDAEGMLYVRHGFGDAGAALWCCDSTAIDWADVDAVRILSPGVTP